MFKNFSNSNCLWLTKEPPSLQWLFALCLLSFIRYNYTRTYQWHNLIDVQHRKEHWCLVRQLAGDMTSTSTTLYLPTYPHSEIWSIYSILIDFDIPSVSALGWHIAHLALCRNHTYWHACLGWQWRQTEWLRGIWKTIRERQCYKSIPIWQEVMNYCKRSHSIEPQLGTREELLRSTYLRR